MPVENESTGIAAGKTSWSVPATGPDHHSLEEELMKKTVVAVAACLSLSAFAFAQKPARNVSASKHPNLAAAQQLVVQA